MRTRLTTDHQHANDLRRVAFDDRYGAGAFDRLLRLLKQPCISFAQIAGHFGVTRERVRQWQQQWFPDTPTGRQRRRQCASYREKKRLMVDSLFREFHRHARAWFGAARIRPLRSRRGYRARAVRIDCFVVALRDATATSPRYRGRADFIYFRLPGGEFLFVAADTPATANRPRNTFAALAVPVAIARAAFPPEEQSL
jgi:hypothetical protein